MDATDTFALLNGESHVAALTPGGAPRVLHDPELFSVLGAIADDKGGVIEAGAALGRVEDSTSVHLEDRLVSLDEDRDWLLGNSGLHLVDVIGLHSLVVGNVGSRCLGSRVFARSILGSVWVVVLELSKVVLPVVEGILLPATTAAVVTVAKIDGSAVDKLLLGEALEFTGLEEMRSLESSGGGESPAGSALALVLDWGDCTLGAPVDGVLVGGIEDGWLLWAEVWLSTAEGLSLELGVVGHGVVAEGERRFGGVVVSDELISLEIESLSGFELFHGEV